MLAGRKRLFRRLFLTSTIILVVVVAVPACVVLSFMQSTDPVGPFLLVVLISLAVGALALLATAYAYTNHLTWCLQQLTVGAERIAHGNYGHQVYAVGQDELGVLSRAFNAMSERLDAQFRQVEEDRQQLRTILSGMVEGVVALDGDQRILFANERAFQLLDFPNNHAVVGRKLWEVLRQRSFQEILQRAQESSEPYRAEIDWNGSTVKSLAVHVARLAGPKARGSVLVLHDTTELRRLERLRQEFVANVSHELKTPLSVIKACNDTLLMGAVDDIENRTSFLEQIDDQTNRLDALILDLLSLARIESGAEVFDFQPVPLEPLVAECLDRHRARAEGKNLVLEEVPPLSPPGPSGGRAATVPAVAAWADEEAVEQILENLVDNALKYTPAGGRIRVRWFADGEHVGLEVQDTGIGIPERDLPHIFERFYRVDKARSRELGGTGLGLSIVKHLTQAVGGTVSATSELGRGTTFHVRLPRASPE
jgi:two-component system phosphate regulon sensor histidine kinase PhoR